MRNAILALAVLAFAGCDGPTDTFTLDPSRWVMLAGEGDSTVAEVEEEFPVGVQLLQRESGGGGAVYLRSAMGGGGADVPLGFNSVPNQLVCFAGKPGAGDPLNSCDMSDSLGVALVRWRLGRLANRPGEWMWIAAFTEIDGAIVATDTLVAQAKPAAVYSSRFLHSQINFGGQSPYAPDPCAIRDKHGNPIPYTLDIPDFAHVNGAGEIVADSVGQTVVDVYVAGEPHGRADLEVRDTNPGFEVRIEAGQSYVNPGPGAPQCPREGY